MSKHCEYCNAKLTDDRARFEVRVAPDYQPRPEAAPGTYCSDFCWEAAKVRKSVEGIAKNLILDAECVLSEEDKLLRRP